MWNLESTVIQQNHHTSVLNLQVQWNLQQLDGIITHPCETPEYGGIYNNLTELLHILVTPENGGIYNNLTESSHILAKHQSMAESTIILWNCCTSLQNTRVWWDLQ